MIRGFLVQDVIENMEIKKRRHGPLPRPAEDVRRIRISVYFTANEATEVRRRAAKVAIAPAAYVRDSALRRLPKQVPEINMTAYRELARVAANLNQIARNLNTLWGDGGLPNLADIEVIRGELARFRDRLGAAKEASFEFKEDKENEGHGQD